MPVNEELTVTDRVMGPDSPGDKRLRVTHYGEARFGDSNRAECAVLSDGRSGYIMRGMRQAIGMQKNIPVPQFEAFLDEIAPNALIKNGKRVPPIEVVLPHGGTGMWVEAGVLTKAASGVIQAALSGGLSKKRMGMVAPCMAIMETLSQVGEEAVIHEATGYQYHRAPDALQDLVSRLIREKVADWERRFHPEYYASICRIFGFQYGGKHKPLPPIVGQITREWVYEVILPPELLDEIAARKKSEKIHQWLEADGLKLLERQITAVSTIAGSSVDYQDFKDRCTRQFPKPGSQSRMVFPRQAEAA